MENASSDIFGLVFSYLSIFFFFFLLSVSFMKGFHCFFVDVHNVSVFDALGVETLNSRRVESECGLYTALITEDSGSKDHLLSQILL